MKVSYLFGIFNFEMREFSLQCDYLNFNYKKRTKNKIIQLKCNYQTTLMGKVV